MPRVQILLPLPRRSKVRFAPFFFCKKNIRLLPCSSFFAKKSRSAHLFACKRAHDGLLSLPTFCELEQVQLSPSKSQKYLFRVTVTSRRKRYIACGDFFTKVTGSFTPSLFLSPKSQRLFGGSINFRLNHANLSRFSYAFFSQHLVCFIAF